jgi:hypothetical protein
MDHSEKTSFDDSRLRLAVIVYYAVMLAVFTVGLYGLFSLFFIASAEIQRNVQLLP